MTKIVRSISIELAIWEKAKELGLNLSKTAEDAIVGAIKSKEVSEDAFYKKAWIAEADMAVQNQAIEAVKAAREMEKKCIEESRELWNESYAALKAQEGLPENIVDRVKLRVEVFEMLKQERAAAEVERLKRAKEAEAKELM